MKNGTQTVGVRDLKAALSKYLKRVTAGERIIVTDRGSPVAVIEPPARSSGVKRLEVLLGSGQARWAGGKPHGASRPARLTRGETVSDAILEDRR